MRLIALAAISGLSNYGVTDDGTLVYLAGGSGTELRVLPVWIDREGREGAAPSVDIDCTCFEPTISPDGSRIAYTQIDLLTLESNIWIWNGSQQTFTRLTFGPEEARGAVWSPDGQRIAYAAADGIYVQRADGTGSAERLR